MTVRLRTLAAAALALALAPAAAAHAGPAITIYTSDLAFVREARTLELAHDRDTVRVPVPERVDFSSVRLAPAGDARVLRLAYRFDVPSGDGALDKARGGRVRVMLRGDRMVEGTLVAVDPSWLVVRDDAGDLHTVARAAVDDARLATAADGLSVRPAVEAVIDGRRGAVKADLSYLTGGMSWSAEHVLVRRGENAATWSSRVTVENTTGRDFADAAVKLLAGEPNREGASRPPMPMAVMAMGAADVATRKADMSEETFSEYHLYTLDRPATLRDRETQSLVMYEPHDLKVRPRYLYRGAENRGVQAQLEFVNDRASGLGVPLPAGRVRVYENDDSGALQFTGESRIEHTAEGEKVTLDVGRAFDLVAERKQTYDKRISDREREYGVEVALRNRKQTAVTVVVEENVGGDTEILQSSHESTRKDANTLQFTIAVPAGKEVVLRYAARQRW